MIIMIGLAGDITRNKKKHLTVGLWGFDSDRLVVINTSSDKHVTKTKWMYGYTHVNSSRFIAAEPRLVRNPTTLLLTV